MHSHLLIKLYKITTPYNAILQREQIPHYLYYYFLLKVNYNVLKFNLELKDTHQIINIVYIYNYPYHQYCMMKCFILIVMIQKRKMQNKKQWKQFLGLLFLQFKLFHKFNGHTFMKYNNFQPKDILLSFWIKVILWKELKCN